MEDPDLDLTHCATRIHESGEVGLVGERRSACF